MVRTELTKQLESRIADGVRAATAKYANSGNVTGGQFANYVLRSHPTQGFANGVGETVRHYIFGDPLTLADELRHKGVGHALKNTFWGPPAHGKLDIGLRALGYALPVGMAAHQYINTPESERPYTRGSMIGGLAGGLVGSTIGNRFGVLGQYALTPAMYSLGSRLGAKFDAKRPEPPAQYTVNSEHSQPTERPNVPQNVPPRSL